MRLTTLPFLCFLNLFRLVFWCVCWERKKNDWFPRALTLSIEWVESKELEIWTEALILLELVVLPQDDVWSNPDVGIQILVWDFGEISVRTWTPDQKLFFLVENHAMSCMVVWGNKYHTTIYSMITMVQSNGRLLHRSSNTVGLLKLPL